MNRTEIAIVTTIKSLFEMIRTEIAIATTTKSQFGMIRTEQQQQLL